MKKILLLLFASLAPLLSMASDGVVADPSSPWTTIIWLSAIIFFVTGIILGCKKIIIIYNDYLDIIISVFIFLFPVIMSFVIDKEDTGLKIVFWLVEIALLSFMLYRTFRFNVNPFAALYALIIKLVFSLLAILCILNLADASQKDVKSYEDYRNRAFILAILGAIVGLVVKMIKSQQWMDSTGFVELRVAEDKTGQEEEIVVKKARRYHKYVIGFCVLLSVILSVWRIHRVVVSSTTTVTIEQTAVSDSVAVELPVVFNHGQVMPKGFEEFINRFDTDMGFRNSHIASGTTYDLALGYIYNGNKEGEFRVGEFSVKNAKEVAYTCSVPESCDGWTLIFKFINGDWMLTEFAMWGEPDC